MKMILATIGLASALMYGCANKPPQRTDYHTYNVGIPASDATATDTTYVLRGSFKHGLIIEWAGRNAYTPWLYQELEDDYTNPPNIASSTRVMPSEMTNLARGLLDKVDERNFQEATEEYAAKQAGASVAPKSARLRSLERAIADEKNDLSCMIK